MNVINYEDISIVKRSDLLYTALLKEIKDISINDLKNQKNAKLANCIIFKDFNNEIKIIK